ncbi:hypothetical protein MIND_00875400 [Mycena indigotica]|uniref:Uncharacterized protein n=1 Tax=Mycena indigotica TaxID=2126181 RepID=A0A8H6VZA4_9AGAR|nr:uncharacterized protein MIND_00875400 [Mycena indigotica]KAF7299267.1 hypothetical protein MIND_00875400 [Mycena indigotica]
MLLRPGNKRRRYSHLRFRMATLTPPFLDLNDDVQVPDYNPMATVADDVKKIVDARELYPSSPAEFISVILEQLATLPNDDVSKVDPECYSTDACNAILQRIDPHNAQMVGRLISFAWRDGTYEELCGTVKNIIYPMMDRTLSSSPIPMEAETPVDHSGFNAADWGYDIPPAAITLLNEIFPNMLDFVSDNRPMPLWSPNPAVLPRNSPHFDHLQSLQIPSWNNAPSLLLHNFGSLLHNPQMINRIDSIFEPKNHIFLVGPSGTGKTRDILEGLCRYWGLYFCFRSKPDDLGSIDLSNSVDIRLGAHPRFVRNLEDAEDDAPPSKHDKYKKELNDNQYLARIYFHQLVLGRLLILKLFLTAIQTLNRPVSFKDQRLWTLLQIRPHLLGLSGGGLRDVFDDLASRLASNSPEHNRNDIPRLNVEKCLKFSTDLVYEMSATLDGTKSPGPPRKAVLRQPSLDSKKSDKDVLNDDKLLASPCPSQVSEPEQPTTNTQSDPPAALKGPELYIVIDEAQIATDLYPNAFRSARHRDDRTGRYVARSVLREYVRASAKYTQFQFGGVLASSGSHMRLVDDEIQSSVFKPGNNFLNIDTGGFYDPDTVREHEAYIKKYIPDDILEEKNTFGATFLGRMTRWLRGRYRTTASFLTYFLMTDLKNPHSKLDAWIKYNTGFTPSDNVMVEVLIFNQGIPKLFDELHYHKIDEQHDLRQVFTSAVYESFARSSVTTSIHGDVAKFVQSGFARFTTEAGDQVKISEPLIILAAITCMENANNKGRRSSKTKPGELIRNYMNATIGNYTGSVNNGFENLIAILLAHTFTQPCRLDEVLEFHPRFRPKWSKFKARLVTLHQEDNAPLPAVYDVDWLGQRVPSGHLGKTCKDSDDVVQWLTHQDPLKTSICFPSNQMGPDIICVLKLENDSFIWLLVQCKNHERRGTNNGVPEGANQTMTDALRTVTPSNFWPNGSKGPFGSKKYPDLRQRVLHALASLPNPATDVDTILQAPTTAFTQLKRGKYPVLRVLATFPPSLGLDRLSIYADEVNDPGSHPLCTWNWEFFSKNDPDNFIEGWLNDYAARVESREGKAPTPRPEQPLVADFEPPRRSPRKQGGGERNDATVTPARTTQRVTSGIPVRQNQDHDSSDEDTSSTPTEFNTGRSNMGLGAYVRMDQDEDLEMDLGP